jgi:hypothetical protein
MILDFVAGGGLPSASAEIILILCWNPKNMDIVHLGRLTQSFHHRIQSDNACDPIVG